MKNDIQKLLDGIYNEARREEFSIDKEVYESCKRDPLKPILYAGTLKSQICFLGRDLGRDEVKNAQPLYGSAGKLIRQGLHIALFGNEAVNSKELQNAADKVLLTNLVPYKPVGNKAYPVKVKKRFRPFIETLLICHWSGNLIIPLGNESLKWFRHYSKEDIAVFMKDPDRFEKTQKIILSSKIDGKVYQKTVTVAPLPHPSPLNQKYYQKFPQMLQNRLEQIGLKV